MKSRIMIGAVVACISLDLGMGTGWAQAQRSLDYKVVAAGQRVRMDEIGSLDPTCRSRGTTEVNLITAPQNGQVETSLGHDYPFYAAANIRAACDKRRVPLTMIFCHASPSFSAWDSFVAELVFPGGTARRVRYTVQVR